MRRTIVILSLLGASLMALLGCLGENREGIAIDVSEEWSDEALEEVSDLITERLAEELPIGGGAVGNYLMEQIEERVSWDFRGIGSEGKDIYRIVAIASLDLDINLPVVEDRTYAIYLPFDLWVNTEDKSVEKWVPKISSVSIEPK